MWHYVQQFNFCLRFSGGTAGDQNPGVRAEPLVQDLVGQRLGPILGFPIGLASGHDKTHAWEARSTVQLVCKIFFCNLSRTKLFNWCWTLSTCWVEQREYSPKRIRRFRLHGRMAEIIETLTAVKRSTELFIQIPCCFSPSLGFCLAHCAWFKDHSALQAESQQHGLSRALDLELSNPESWPSGGLDASKHGAIWWIGWCLTIELYGCQC